MTGNDKGNNGQTRERLTDRAIILRVKRSHFDFHHFFIENGAKGL
jgi:hypothetical protein